MKKSNYANRKKNGIIVSIIITILILLCSILFVHIATLNLKAIIKIPLIITCSFLVILVLPFALFRLQNTLYNYLNKNIDIVEANLSSEFKPIYINTDCLKKSSIPLSLERNYMAKLNNDDSISIVITNKNNINDTLSQKTSDYTLFLTMFKFTDE